MAHDERHPSRRTFLAVAGVTTVGVVGCGPSGTPTAAVPAPGPDREHSGLPSVEVNGPADPSDPHAATVPKRKLGRSGELVSMLGLGGYHIGQASLSEDDAVRLIRRAIDNGVTFLDNCWDYNGGRSEERVGKALADGYRKRAFVMTKLDGRTRDAARDQLAQSLARLKTDQIDLVQIHEVIRMEDPERCFAENGAIHALVEARREGRLRYIGFTGHKSPAIHRAMLDAAEKHGFSFDTVQMPLNVLDANYESFEKHVLPLLVERGVGVLGMKSMGSGEILKSKLVSPEECLRYALSLPTSVVISGMDRDELLDKNLALARQLVPVEGDERTALLARVAGAAKNGEFEPFKTSHKYDGTYDNPHWLEAAKL